MLHFESYPPEQTGSRFRLSHISDPHLSTLHGVSWKQLLNKRILGYLSWRLNRRFIHKTEILQLLLEDLDQQGSHHLIISGDLTHIGLAGECEQVANWLADLGTADDISVIPGNHDRYVRDDFSATLANWSNYMCGDGPKDFPGLQAFPSYRRRGPLAIIGLSSAVPTAPFFASGRLGERQLGKLGDCLEQAKLAGLFRVVVVHHGPLEDSNKFRKRLIDAAPLREMLQSAGAELVLHGHGHYPVIDCLGDPDSGIPVVGAASASLLSGSDRKRAGYNLYDVRLTETGWQLNILTRRYDESAGQFTDWKQRDFLLSRP